MRNDLALADDLDGKMSVSASGDAKALSQRAKAAIVVRLLLAEGIDLPLADLPPELQAELSAQMARMDYVDRDTLRQVIEEFAGELDRIGVIFPGGLDGVLSILEGAISPDIAARLRLQNVAIWDGDPWTSLLELSDGRLQPFLEEESAEVAAVILSKLPVTRAAALLGKLQGDRARRITLAISETSKVAPDVVQRIGVALASELHAKPKIAFTAAAVERLGAILNASKSAKREEILAAISEEDEALAEQVRKAIFAFEHIPDRISPDDVAVIARGLDQEDLVKILAGRTTRNGASADFLLDNMPKRLADQIREGADYAATPDPADVERIEADIVAKLRQLGEAGEIRIHAASETEPAD